MCCRLGTFGLSAAKGTRPPSSRDVPAKLPITACWLVVQGVRAKFTLLSPERNTASLLNIQLATASTVLSPILVKKPLFDQFRRYSRRYW